MHSFHNQSEDKAASSEREFKHEGNNELDVRFASIGQEKVASIQGRVVRGLGIHLHPKEKPP